MEAVLRLIQDTNPSKGSGFLFCVIHEFAFYGSEFIYSDVNKGLVDNFSLSSISTGQIVGLVAFFIMQTIAAGLSIYLLNYIGQKIVAGLRERLWKNLYCQYLIMIKIEQAIQLAE